MEAGAKGKTYKIGQAAKLLDVKPFVLRFWEGEFKDVLVPVRTPSGQRAYTEGNVELVREIKRLLYDEGLTIEGAKKRLREAKPGTRPAVRSGPQPTCAASDQPSGQTPPQIPLAPAPSASAPSVSAPAAPAQPGHSPEPLHFDGQPALPGLARPERLEAAHAAQAAALTAAQVAADAEVHAARQQSARAEQSAAAATVRADEAAARAEALAQALTHFRQELLAIRDLLG
ncbi:MerR family transcriptional regulator [Humidesulfovibrio sp.]